MAWSGWELIILLRLTFHKAAVRPDLRGTAIASPEQNGDKTGFPHVSWIEETNRNNSKQLHDKVILGLPRPQFKPQI